MKTSFRVRPELPVPGPADGHVPEEKERIEEKALENDEALRPEAQPLNTRQQAEVGDVLLSARAVSRQMVTQAREQSDEILKTARDRAEQIVQEAEDKAAAILLEAEEKAAAMMEEAAQPRDVMSPEMQEYVVKCVGECFSRLRQQQLETVDFINDQWRSFLSGLTLEEPKEKPKAAPPVDEISRQDIEARVSAIAKELMDILGN